MRVRDKQTPVLKTSGANVWEKKVRKLGVASSPALYVMIDPSWLDGSVISAGLQSRRRGLKPWPDQDSES